MLLPQEQDKSPYNAIYPVINIHADYKKFLTIC